MIFAFLDEFGHSGPYLGRDHPKHNTSPVFGLAGYLMPEHHIRGFGRYFIERKKEFLAFDLEKTEKQAYEWEKKGTNLFTAASITKYPKIRDSMFRMLSELKKRDGKVFYYGREKIRRTEDLNPSGLYKTIFAHAIRHIDAYCDALGENFVVVLDENTARLELLQTAAKTMFGQQPARRMISPPFEVESHLNQNIQAADWIATIVGRLWNRRLDPEGFANFEAYERYFWTRIHSLATHSTVMKRPTRPKPAESLGILGEKLKAAQERKQAATVNVTVRKEVSLTMEIEPKAG